MAGALGLKRRQSSVAENIDAFCESVSQQDPALVYDIGLSPYPAYWQPSMEVVFPSNMMRGSVALGDAVYLQHDGSLSLDGESQLLAGYVSSVDLINGDVCIRVYGSDNYYSSGDNYWERRERGEVIVWYDDDEQDST